MVAPHFNAAFITPILSSEAGFNPPRRSCGGNEFPPPTIDDPDRRLKPPATVRGRTSEQLPQQKNDPPSLPSYGQAGWQSSRNGGRQWAGLRLRGGNKTPAPVSELVLSAQVALVPRYNFALLRQAQHRKITRDDTT